ncbi:MAG: beta-eliminating lyase-related protein [Bacteroidales bacterium]|nr:beta-eliminating lyase-related protein [Bacteroidales bacterium]
MSDQKLKRGFASDNNSGVHPAVMEEIMRVNHGHTVGYGSDPFTARAVKLLRKELGEDSEVSFVFTGTAANVLGLAGVTRSWNSVITASSAHIEEDECGAPEKFTGCKVLTVDTPDGKLRPDLLRRHMHGFGFEHHSQPAVISISQSTEMGTVYSVNEIRELAAFAHDNSMLLHMDGARLANAAVSLGLPFRAFTTDAGVDVLSFGGTKNGMMYGEAVCFLKPGLAEGFKYLRKQGMQLASKMRFIAAQYIAYLNNELWKECASHSNMMALELEKRIRMIKGVTITQKVESNGIFLIMPEDVADRLSREYFFYPWNEELSEYRLMTSWDTASDDIIQFADRLSVMMSEHR